MVKVYVFHVVMEGNAGNKIEHANDIVRFILDPISMHEVLMAGDQIQNASLFFGAAKALEFDAADMGCLFFVKDEFDGLLAAAFKVNGALYPKFDLVIHPKAPFFGVMVNEIGTVAQNNHIAIFHPKEIRGVRMNFKSVGALGGRKPSRSQLPKFLLRWMCCHF
jgi:hypothetical protein